MHCITYLRAYVIGWLWAQSEVAKGQQHLLATGGLSKNLMSSLKQINVKAFHLLSLFHWLSPCLSRITVCSKPLPTSMEVSPAPSPIWKSYDVHNLTAKKCENVLLHPLEIFSLPFSLLWRFAGWPRCERRWAAAASWDSMQRLLLASPPSSLTETLTSVASLPTL